MARRGNKGKSKKNKREEASSKPRLMERFTEMLELPKEIVLDMPKLTMLGNGDLIIENYKGIIEYCDNTIRINTKTGVVKVTGSKLYIKEITSENIMIYGSLSMLEFLK